MPAQVPDCIQRMQAWIEEMSAYVKALDPNHLVTVGAEGFWGPVRSCKSGIRAACQRNATKSTRWAACGCPPG